MHLMLLTIPTRELPREGWMNAGHLLNAWACKTLQELRSDLPAFPSPVSLASKMIRRRCQFPFIVKKAQPELLSRWQIPCNPTYTVSPQGHRSFFQTFVHLRIVHSVLSLSTHTHIVNPRAPSLTLSKQQIRNTCFNKSSLRLQVKLSPARD